MLSPTRSTRPEPTAQSCEELRKSLAVLSPELYGRALRMARCPAAAQDLVQDTVERAMRFETHYQHGTNVRAWVNQILFSVFITKCRRRRRERNALEHLATDPCAWTQREQPAPMDALSPSVQRALAALPASFRQAVELVDLKELSYKDAAARAGVPVGTIMSRLHRGRRLLATSLRSEASVDTTDACEQTEALAA